MQKNNVGKIMADCRSKEALLKRANEKIVQLEQSVKNYEEVIEAFDKDNSEKIEMRDTIPQVTARIDSAKKFMEDRQADILELENENRKLSSNEKNGRIAPFMSKAKCLMKRAVKIVKDVKRFLCEGALLFI